MECRELNDMASHCKVKGALFASNDFDTVYDKGNEFMQVYWSSYNSPNLTSKNDHEAACHKAIQFCMDNGASREAMQKIVDRKAPMAAWYRDGSYAVRMVGDVCREKEARKENSTDMSR